MNREPVLLVAAIVALLNLALHYFDIAVDTDALEGLVSSALVIAGAILARRKVMPVETVRQAGLSPAQVKQDAADPSVPRYQGAR